MELVTVLHTISFFSRYIPSTAFVEKNAKFLVSSGFSFVYSMLRDCGSDSPVRDELSTLKPRLSRIRMSAGIRSPNLTSTTSPITMSSARSVSFSPCRITVANCWKRQVLIGYLIAGVCYPYLGDHVLEWFHNPGAFAFLVVRENARDDDDNSQHNSKVQLKEMGESKTWTVIWD